MPSSTFKSTVSITHIGTATAILSIDGINFLTDPFVNYLLSHAIRNEITDTDIT